MNNVIPLRRTINESYEIVVLRPSYLNPMTQAVQALQESKVVIVNLEYFDKHHAQRILDFISGSAYAISGHPVKVGTAVFLFTPYNIQIQSKLAG